MVFGNIWIISSTNKKHCQNLTRSDIIFWICACLSALVYAYSIRPGPKFMTFFLLNLTEHEFSTAHKNKNAVKFYVSALKFSDIIFILLMNVKVPTILTFISRTPFGSV